MSAAERREGLMRACLEWEHSQGRFTYCDRPDIPIPFDQLSPKRLEKLGDMADFILARVAL